MVGRGNDTERANENEAKIKGKGKEEHRAQEVKLNLMEDISL